MNSSVIADEGLIAVEPRLLGGTGRFQNAVPAHDRVAAHLRLFPGAVNHKNRKLRMAQAQLCRRFLRLYLSYAARIEHDAR